MDRQIVYSGAIPLDTDLLSTNKNVMISIGMALQAILGPATQFDGLACTPTGPASLQVLVGPGSVYSNQNVDSAAYGNLASDTTHQIVKQGINLGTLTLSCPAPSTTGQSVNYLIQAAYQDADTGATVLPYYNSSNPAVAYNGPNNTGVSQNTVRQGQCVIAVKTGIAATTGSQTTPAPDAGYTGLWVVTVANGQTTITSGNISAASGSPFIANKLTALAPLASPAFTGVPTVPTAAPGTNTTQAASTAFVQNAVGGGTRRTLLTGNTTYYVSTAGNDSTGNGTSGSPWATIQHAANYIGDNIDLGWNQAKIKLAATGSYAGVTITQPWVGGGPGNVIIEGDTTTPSNTIITTASGDTINATGSGVGLTYQFVQLSNTAGGFACVHAQNGAQVIQGAGVIFGSAGTGFHFICSTHSLILISANYTIAGDAFYHYLIYPDGNISVFASITITLSGSRTFNTFAFVPSGKLIFSIPVATFSGSGTTGVYYNVSGNGVISTNGSSSSYLPGSSAGSTATGGQYL